MADAMRAVKPSAPPSPACGRRWPDEVGSDEGSCRSGASGGMRWQHPSSDPASRRHLLPPVGEGRAALILRKSAQAVAALLFLQTAAQGAEMPPPLPAPASLARPVPICDLIEEAARSHALPLAFFTRLIWRESRFRPHALSPAGAQGVAQFMPGTAAERGLVDPYAAREALMHSAAFLDELRTTFGNFGLAAAAYNAGPGRVTRWLAGQSELPQETLDYVPAVTGHDAQAWRASPPPALARGQGFRLRPLCDDRRTRAGASAAAGRRRADQAVGGDPPRHPAARQGDDGNTSRCVAASSPSSAGSSRTSSRSASPASRSRVTSYRSSADRAGRRTHSARACSAPGAPASCSPTGADEGVRPRLL